MPRASADPAARAIATLDSIGDAVVSIDVAGRIIYLNPAAEEMTGWTFAAAEGRPFSDVCRLVDCCTGAPTPIPVSLRRQQTAGGSTILIGPNGRRTPVEQATAPMRGSNGDQDGTVIVLRDIAASVERTIDLLERAQQDPLTGLPNRLVLHDRLSDAVTLARRHHRALAVLFLDVDGFKSVNDTHGHPAGDRLLKAIAVRLSSTLRESDTVSRCGGDEFVIVLPEIEHAGHAESVGRKLLHAVSGALDILAVHATASIGIAVYPEHGQDADTLIANADAAMYAAKRDGPGLSRLFERHLRPRNARFSRPETHPVSPADTPDRTARNGRRW